MISDKQWCEVLVNLLDCDDGIKPEGYNSLVAVIEQEYGINHKYGNVPEIIQKIFDLTECDMGMVYLNDEDAKDLREIIDKME